MLVDLHTHSTFSDGILTVPQLVKQSKRKGIKILALTDHDTVNGLQLFQKECQRHGIKCLPGIEFSTQIENQELHIVGYKINYRFKPFLEVLRLQQKKRMDRAKLVIKRFQKLGLDLPQQIVNQLLKQPNVGKPQLGRAILREKKNRFLLKKIFNFQGSLSDFIGKFLDQPGQVGYVHKEKINSLEAVKMIIKAQGKAVLAHPDIDLPNSSLAQHLLAKLCRAGLWGMEKPHVHLKQVPFFQKLAEQNNLVLTYGSDTHDGKRMGVKISNKEYQKLLNNFK